MWAGGGGDAPRLSLTIRNVDSLENGVPTRIDLEQRGAVIGRSATVDWSLPDPRSYISSRHCEIDYVDGVYRMIDVSTNGTFINGSTERSFDPVPLKTGDVLTVGQYEIVVAVSGGAPAAAAPPSPPPPPANAGWGAWDTPVAPAGNASTSNWGGEPTPPASLGGGATSAAWAPPAVSGSDGGWGAPAAPPPPPAAPSPPPGNNAAWGAPPASDWGAASAAPSPPAADGWGAPAPAPSNAGWGAAPSAAVEPSSNSWGVPQPPPPAPPAAFAPAADAFAPSPAAHAEPARNPSSWDAAPERAQAASGWSSAVADRPAAPSADDVWGKINEGNVVDWARGGFGQAAPPPLKPADPLGLTPQAAAALPTAAPPIPGGSAAPPAAAPAASFAGFGAPPVAAPSAAAPPTYSPPPPAAMPPQAPPPQVAAPTAPPSGVGDGQAMARFLAETGLKRSDLKGNDGDVMAAAGGLARRLVAGLVVMLEARARAKSQMGAQSTALEFDGNNPIKFARTPEGALAQLLNPVERGFMNSERAVEDAFHDLQSHQIATLKAMQGALKATLDRFSPNAIKARAESKGLMSRILPGAREAALWQAYEREFGGVAQGSDEAFMEVFSREFKRAYEEQAARRPKR